MRTELLPGGGYEYDEGALTLSSPTGGRYTLGTPLRVTLLRADPRQRPDRLCPGRPAAPAPSAPAGARAAQTVGPTP